jgi:hypothetical protein
LEPSCGRGDLVKYVCENMKSEITFDLYEIDDTINFIINKNNIVFGNFLN